MGPTLFLTLALLLITSPFLTTAATSLHDDQNLDGQNGLLDGISLVSTWYEPGTSDESALPSDVMGMAYLRYEIGFSDPDYGLYPFSIQVNVDAEVKTTGLPANPEEEEPDNVYPGIIITTQPSPFFSEAYITYSILPVMTQSHLLPLLASDKVGLSSTPTLTFTRGFLNAVKNQPNPDWDRHHYRLQPHFIVISIPISKALYTTSMDGNEFTLPLGYSVNFSIAPPTSAPTTITLSDTIKPNPKKPIVYDVTVENTHGDWTLSGIAMKLSGNYQNVHSIDQKFGYLTNLHMLYFIHSRWDKGQIFDDRDNKCTGVTACRRESITVKKGTTLKWTELTHSSLKIDITNTPTNNPIENGYYYWVSSSVSGNMVNQGYDHRWNVTAFDHVFDFDQQVQSEVSIQKPLEAMHRIFPSYIRTDVYVTQLVDNIQDGVGDDVVVQQQVDTSSLLPTTTAQTGLQYSRIISRPEHLSFSKVLGKESYFPWEQNSEQGSATGEPAFYILFSFIILGIIAAIVLAITIVAGFVFFVLHYGFGLCPPKPAPAQQQQQSVELSEQRFPPQPMQIPPQEQYPQQQFNLQQPPTTTHFQGHKYQSLAENNIRTTIQ